MKKTLAKDLNQPRAHATNTINAQAQTHRNLITTPGMELVYAMKMMEVQRFFALYRGPSEPPANASISFPMISAEVGLMGASMWDVAQTMNAAIQKTIAHYAAIERVRLQANQHIKDAPHEKALSDVVGSVIWPKDS